MSSMTDSALCQEEISELIKGEGTKQCFFSLSELRRQKCNLERLRWLEFGEQSTKVGFPGSPVVKNPPANAGDVGSIPGLGISPGGGNSNPLQYSCLQNPVDRGA